MSSNVYNSAMTLLLNGGLDWDSSSSIKCLLVSGSYTPDKDHQFVADVVANELSGAGYTGGYQGSGRKTLAARAVNKDNATDRVYCDDTADITWAAINAGTPAYAIVFREVTSDAASPLVACIEISNPVPTNGGDYTLQWASGGLFYVQQ